MLREQLIKSGKVIVVAGLSVIIMSFIWGTSLFVQGDFFLGLINYCIGIFNIFTVRNLIRSNKELIKQAEELQES